MEILILPNQLFDYIFFPKVSGVVLWEHPQYFTKYSYNLIKLVYHRATMKYYADYLRKRGLRVRYVEFADKSPTSKMLMFRPADDIKMKHVEYIENPNFLLTPELHEEYRNKTKHYFFNAFYMFFKKKLNILPEIKSTDRNNRQRPTKKINVVDFSIDVSKYLRGAEHYISTHFDGKLPDLRNWTYPITHSQAQQKLEHFIKHKSNNFAPLQDYMDFDNKSGELYHSGLSACLNIGLLNPADLIKRVLKVRNMNFKETFIRQLFWREYQLYCYRFCAELRKPKNFFGNKKKLTPVWYSGNVGIEPVDACIKKAFQTGYLHHIERLMIMGNFMLLYGIRPSDAFRWFMEFSIDSYEWVMYQNVYEMVYNSTGGMTMRRIYISSSAYVLKMSNLTRGDWCDEWDMLFRDFVRRHKSRLSYPYR
jgi:deoxyribodipyrimidine photolyase-related protein